ncbi:hypothetical protein HS5_21330 [Acidianus sp. HS-5]|nr:hypothetical protein HS5_21330 [Acidianus sp. HS-5]
MYKGAIRMVYEQICDSCGELREVKYCSVKKINACYRCCVECKIRDKCNIRVWFKELQVIR